VLTAATKSSSVRLLARCSTASSRALSSSAPSDERFATKASKHREMPASALAGLSTPIVTATTYKLASAAHGATLCEADVQPSADKNGYLYSRWGSPTTHVVAETIADLEVNTRSSLVLHLCRVRCRVQQLAHSSSAQEWLPSALRFSACSRGQRAFFCIHSLCSHDRRCSGDHVVAPAAVYGKRLATRLRFVSATFTLGMNMRNTFETSIQA
jgi:cystathionine beta-lyase/cystathionine gamma-synthase